MEKLKKDKFGFSGDKSMVFSILKKRPMTLDDIFEVVKIKREIIKEHIESFTNEGLLHTSKIENNTFYWSRKI
jgi:predicted ArsR family transcriptional regulator